MSFHAHSDLMRHMHTHTHTHTSLTLELSGGEQGADIDIVESLLHSRCRASGS